MIGPVYQYSATAVRIVDGDTFEASIDLGFNSYQREHLRLKDYNAPELNEPGGGDAARRLHALLWDYDHGRYAVAPLIVQTFKTSGGNTKRSFTRYIADCYLPDGRLLQDVLRQDAP